MLFNNALYFYGGAHQLGALTNAGWSLKRYLLVQIAIGTNNAQTFAGATLNLGINLELG
jgi:hypothetical protein